MLLGFYRFLDFAFTVSRVAIERPCGGELSELVSDHIFRHIDRNELPSIMNRKGIADHFGNDRGTPRSCLDDPLFSSLNQSVNFLEQMVVNKRTFSY